MSVTITRCGLRERHIGYKRGNGTRETRNVDVWMEEEARLLAKKSHCGKGDTGLKRTIACAFYIRARVCLFIRETSFLIAARPRKNSPQRRTPDAALCTRSAVLSRKRREKRGLVARISFVVPWTRSCMWRTKNSRRRKCSSLFSLIMMSFVYKKYDRYIKHLNRKLCYDKIQMDWFKWLVVNL